MFLTDLKKFEEEKDKVNFYFDEITNKRQCFGFLIKQEIEVDNTAPAIVRLYDYYQQELFVEKVKFKFPFFLKAQIISGLNSWSNTCYYFSVILQTLNVLMKGCHIPNLTLELTKLIVY